MSKISIPYRQVYDYSDCVRIQRVIAEKFGAFITIEEAHLIWTEYSEDTASCWNGLPESDEDLLNVCLKYITFQG